MIFERPCKHLAKESLNGTKMFKCADYYKRPFGCALYPFDPEDELIQGCGYRWEDG